MYDAYFKNWEQMQNGEVICPVQQMSGKSRYRPRSLYFQFNVFSIRLMWGQGGGGEEEG